MFQVSLRSPTRYTRLYCLVNRYASSGKGNEASKFSLPEGKKKKGDLQSLLKSLKTKTEKSKTMPKIASVPPPPRTEVIMGDPEIDHKLSIAVKQVAKAMGDNPVKREQELLQKLRQPAGSSDANTLLKSMTIERPQKFGEEGEELQLEPRGNILSEDVLEPRPEGHTFKYSKKAPIREKIKEPIKPDPLDEKLSMAEEAVSDVVSGNETELELLTRMREHSVRGKAGQKQSSFSFKGMKVEKKTTESDVQDLRMKKFPDEQFSKLQKHKKNVTRPQMVSLDSGTRLGIFSKELIEQKGKKQGEILETWAKQQQRDIETELIRSPRNAFEEQIMWTKQGKLWLFPINNEQGLEEETKVGFHEHVFLERHLTGLPKKGPIRVFMELVCVGLSKNHFLTVSEKIQQINEFKQYFNVHKEMLKKAGALDD